MSDKQSDSTPTRQGKAWDNDEDRRLYDAFVSQHSVSALAAHHRRSEGGIRARLQRLGLIDVDGNTVDPAPAFEPPESRRAARKEGAPNAPRWTFAATLPDGSRLELKSNRPITRATIEQLAAMLEDET